VHSIVHSTDPQITPVKSTFSVVIVDSSCLCGTSPPLHEFITNIVCGKLAEIAELFEVLPLFRAVLPDHRQPELGGFDARAHARAKRSYTCADAIFGTYPAAAIDQRTAGYSPLCRTTTRWSPLGTDG
jgi:hypothetical protein